MGNQVCCIQQREVGQTKVELICAQEIQLPAEDVFPLTSEAEKTYRRLMSGHQEDMFLGVPSEAEDHLSIVYREGYFKLPKGDVCYNGEWNKDVPEGRGRVIFRNGGMLIGQFKNNHCTYDHCFFIFPSGAYYEGNIKQNKLAGKGKMVHPELAYQGNWENNKPHGAGEEIMSNGDKYVGTFVRGKKYGNNCLYQWSQHPTLSQYKGTFQLGKINGQGTLILRNGTLIQGIFDDNSIENATCISNTLSCKGTFRNGKLQGSGTVQLRGKQEYIGCFREGQLYGNCTYVDGKSRQNRCFMFGGRRLRSVVGLSDEEIKRVLEVVEKVYKNVSIHSEAVIKLNHELRGDYSCKQIRPFENYFEKQQYLIMNCYDSTILIQKTR